MPTIDDIRQQYPDYNDLSDTQLADALHAKFYSDIPKEDFYQRIGGAAVTDPNESFGNRFLKNIELAANTVNPWADEAAAGIRSVLPGHGSYSDELAAIHGGQEQYRQMHPGQARASEIIGALASAPFLPGGEELAAMEGVLPTAGVLAKQGAGYGAFYGAGNAEPGSRLEGAAKGGLLGLAAGPVFGGTLYGLSKVAAIPSAISDLFAGFTAKPEQLAAEQLAPSAAAIHDVPAADPTNPLYQYRTLAEATQDPYLAQLEQNVGKSNPLANSLLAENRASRRDAQVSLLDTLSGARPLNESEGGAALRDILEPAAAGSKQNAESLFNAIDRGGALPIDDVRSAFNKSMGSTYEAGGAPSSLESIKRELASAVKPAAPEAGTTQISADDYQRLLSGAAEDPTKPFSYVHSLRQRAQDAWTAAKNVGDSRAAATANGLIRTIDGVIERAGETGAMSPEDVATFANAKAAYSDFARTYQDGPIGAALRKMGADNYSMNVSKVVDRVFTGTAENTQKLLRALPDDPAAVDSVRGLVRDKLLRDAVTNDGYIKPGTFRNKLRQMREGLTATTPDGRQLFEPEHLDTLEKLSEDLSFLDTQSTKSIRSLANVASEGQSTTAQALFMQQAFKQGALRRLPIGKQLVALSENMLNDTKEQANNLLARALIDKNFAKVLVSNATPLRVSLARTALDSTSSGLDALAELIPRLAGTAVSPQQPANQPPSPSGFGTSDLQSRLAPAGTSLFGPPRSVFALGASNGLNGTTGDPAMSEKSGPATAQLPQASSVPPGNTGPNTMAPLLDAIKQVESGGNSKAVSPKGALGPYQFTPATAKDYGVTDPFDEKQAREGAQKKLLADFQHFGDMRLALAAYNAGRGKIDRLLKEAGGSTYDDIEPLLKDRLRETYDYIPKVAAELAKLTG